MIAETDAAAERASLAPGSGDCSGDNVGQFKNPRSTNSERIAIELRHETLDTIERMLFLRAADQKIGRS
ncbi:hypothetical protein SS05631_b61250 (plasmid) [Sinorhizobium sp. CCBAU 05631]|uniref:Uncharacterized protein n=1 Tax=Rhizobium fredii TaxID=380 RepID=A0A2L0HFY5_RHIFR|nr:hypothetical protein SS05631_b61250 [Sinorhizobium sp. CCBAU 05631]AUX80411.1 hypothetical protein NXT3_PC01258 [Sinorhizobium fredii]